MSVRIFLLTCILPILLGTFPAWAQTAPPEILGHFGQWQAYHFQENGQPVCYMVTSKLFAGSKKFRRGTAYLMVTHRPQENALDVVNYSPGYILASKHEVKMSFGTTSFSLFADKDSAWARSPHMDHALVAAMQNNKTVTIVAVPIARDVPAQKDTLTITGATAAYQAIGKACGLTAPTLPKTMKKRNKTSP